MQFYRLDKDGQGSGTSVPLSRLLEPFLQARGDHASSTEMRDYLLDLERQGQIAIQPSFEAIRNVMLHRAVLEWAERATVKDGGPRFAADRQGGRINPRLRQAVALNDLERAAHILAIERTLYVEGPAMYRGQAMLLAMLDPAIDAAEVARKSVKAVREAVNAGIQQAREQQSGEAA